MRAAISADPFSGAGVAIKGIDVRPGAPLADALQHLKAGSIDGLRSRKTVRNCRESFSASRLAENVGAVNRQAGAC